MSVWTIKFGGETKTLAEWNLKACLLELVSVGCDTLRLRTDELFDADPQWPDKSFLELFQDGTRRFYGRIIAPDPISTATSEGIGYEVKGPWWFAENLSFTQSWAPYGGGAAVNYPRAFLFNGVSAQAVVTEALQKVIDFSTPAVGSPMTTLALGTITAPLRPPIERVTNLMCSEVIVKTMRLLPAHCWWFDYTTAGAPTFNLAPPADMTAVSVALGDCKNAHVVRSYEQQVPFVRIWLKRQRPADASGTVIDLDDPLAAALARYITDFQVAIYPPSYGTGLNEFLFGGLEVAEDEDPDFFTLTDAQNAAQTFYESVQALGWRTRSPLVIDGDEPDMRLRPGVKLNITGGRAELETMNAVVQRVVHDIMGTTSTVECGPSKQLGIGDLRQLLLAWRGRVSAGTTATAEQTTGESPSQNFGFPKPDGGDDGSALFEYTIPSTLGWVKLRLHALSGEVIAEPGAGEKIPAVDAGAPEWIDRPTGIEGYHDGDVATCDGVRTFLEKDDPEP